MTRTLIPDRNRQNYTERSDVSYPGGQDRSPRQMLRSKISRLARKFLFRERIRGRGAIRLATKLTSKKPLQSSNITPTSLQSKITFNADDYEQ